MNKKQTLEALSLLVKNGVSKSRENLTLLKRGADGYEGDFVLISKSFDQDKKTTLNPRCEPIPLSSIERIRGKSVPVLVDSESMVEILERARFEMSLHEIELEAREEKIQQLQERVWELESECRSYFLLLPWWKRGVKRAVKKKILKSIG